MRDFAVHTMVHSADVRGAKRRRIRRIMPLFFLLLLMLCIGSCAMPLRTYAQTVQKASSLKQARKKKLDFSAAEFFHYEEGLCVQCMHLGDYDNEPATVDRMHRFMEEQGYALDITDQRMHHEIYLSDNRKVAPEKLKTVIRHPNRKA